MTMSLTHFQRKKVRHGSPNAKEITLLAKKKGRYSPDAIFGIERLLPPCAEWWSFFYLKKLPLGALCCTVLFSAILIF
jgi:hypothetical protein